ncbi:MAG: acetolactate synthase large subunit, partial [Candidatus Accumulibacter sp.]|nr:acetolactate synthase large subunit [Accumulibacter sp.]
TAAEEGVNVKLVLMNNASLGLVAQQQTLFYEGRIFASKFGSEPDFPGIARRVGWRTFDLSTADEPKDALAAALSTPGPVFIHARIDARAQVLPMVAPGGANKDMIGG